MSRIRLGFLLTVVVVCSGFAGLYVHGCRDRGQQRSADAVEQNPQMRFAKHAALVAIDQLRGSGYVSITQGEAESLVEQKLRHFTDVYYRAQDCYQGSINDLSLVLADEFADLPNTEAIDDAVRRTYRSDHVAPRIVPLLVHGESRFVLVDLEEWQGLFHRCCFGYGPFSILKAHILERYLEDANDGRQRTQ